MAASAYITLTARDAVTPTLKKIQGEMEAMARSVRRFGDNFTSFATLGFGTGTALGIYEVGKASIEAQIQLERLDKSFTAIYNSSSAARQQLEFVRQTSMELGQEFYSSAEAAKTFFAAGQGTSLSGQLNQIYTGFSKAGAALALSSDDMQGIFLALGQSMSKGKVQTEELRGQIGERLPGAFQIAAKAMGMSTAELDKFMADGKLLTDDLLPKMAQALDDRYGKAAESAADTVQAAINRMSTAWTEFKAGLLDSGPAVFTIKFVTEVLEGKNAAEAARKRKEQLDSELERIGAQKSVVGQTIIGGIGAAPEVQPVMGYTDAQRQALARQKAMDDAVNRQLQQGLQQQEQTLTKGREAITKALKETTASRRAALEEEKADALKAIDDMVVVYRKQGADVESLLKEREKVSKAYDDKIAALDKKAGKGAVASARQAAVAQANYNGELERTRQAIDSLQQQLGLDKTEDLARAKIRIEQQYQATLSKTNEELAKQVAQGKLMQGQADTLQAEKAKAAELQKQVALRDAEQKAQERQYKDLQTAADFYRELGDLSGSYGQSIEYQNQLIEHQAQLYRTSGIPEALVQQWQALKKLETARDPWSGFARTTNKYFADATNWAEQLGSIWGNTMDGMTDALTEFCMTGKLNFNDLANDFIRQVIRMQMQAAVSGLFKGVTGLAMGALGGMFGGTFSSSQLSTMESNGMRFSGGSGSWLTGVHGHHRGGVVGISAPTFTRSVPALAFAGAPRFHNGGGWFRSDEYPAILQRGERVLNRDETRAYHAGMQAGGYGGSQVVVVEPQVHIENNTASTVRTETSMSGGVPRIDIFIDEIDSRLADRIGSGRSRLGRAIDMTRGTNRARSTY